MIEFLCPNGHRIHCPDEQAGRAAKCPRCGVKFRIPDPSDAEIPYPTDGDSEVSQPELSDSGSGIATPPAGGQDGTSGQQSLIEFLCPNGHRLHGPASLQGRPGECPECGSKFRIPTYEDVSEEEATEQEIGVGRAGGSGESAVTLPRIDQIEGPSEENASGTGAAGHPLAQLFSKLWAEKPQGAAVELHLSDGETLVPERFAKALSQQNHGVFAVKEPGGTHSLTVVAWESIVRVLVRGVKQLPEEMAE